MAACAETPSSSAPRSSVNFISVWKVEPTDLNIQLPLVENGVYDFRVDWGDNNKDQITAWNAPEKIHSYGEAGEYTVKISGKFTGWSFKESSQKTNKILAQEANKILEIKQWGGIGLGETTVQFAQASLLTISATDSPDLTGTRSLEFMFEDASALSKPDFSGWDTSEITNMNSMFSGASKFDGDISSWDTSEVTNMSSMFSSIRGNKFNGDISNWETSKVTNMSGMFSGASSFNGDISRWNTSEVTTMGSMFFGASSFNGDISKWKTSKVTNMIGMFARASSFNGDISKWQTGEVTGMDSMFHDAIAFNRDISGWDTSKVTEMSGMFLNASAFNQDISNWDVSAVLYKDRAFEGSKIANNTNKQPVF